MLNRIFFQQTIINYFIALIFLILAIGISYRVERTDFVTLIVLYSTFFGLYLVSYWKVIEKHSIYFFVGIAILLRFILLFSFPNFSDDIYRFVWDGRLMVNGLNPFDHLPAYYINNQIEVAGLTKELYLQLNSPEYFTIYPPVAQLNFAIANGLFPHNLVGATFIMKLQLFLFEIGAIYLVIKLLKEFKLPAKNVLLYALNPLILFEISGNLHFEGAMIFFLLLAVFLLIKNKWIWSAAAFALSIAAKLLPLMFLPFLIKRLGWGRSVRYFVVVGGILLLFFAPLFSGAFFNNFGESLNLYFQKFEFNASVYYALRWVGYQYKGYNIIQELGPTLALGTLTGIVGIALLERHHWKDKIGGILEMPPIDAINWQSLFSKMLFAITLYLAFTTIVHPWYTVLPVALCIFTNYRYPILWSGLIFFTYINYSYHPYYENLWVVAIEYVVVGIWMFSELYIYNNRRIAYGKARNKKRF